MGKKKNLPKPPRPQLSQKDSEWLEYMKTLPKEIRQRINASSKNVEPSGFFQELDVEKEEFMPEEMELIDVGRP